MLNLLTDFARKVLLDSNAVSHGLGLVSMN